MKWVAINKLRIDEDLSSIFPMGELDIAAIAESMKERGFDEAEPLVVWKDEGVVVDGHTRRAAAERAGLDRVFIDERSFEDKRAAVEYAIRRQRDRRNLTRPELTRFVTRAVELLDRVKTAGRPEKLASMDANFSGKSAAETAEQLQISQAQVERLRTVLASDDEGLKEDLRDGKTTIRAAYTEVRKAESARHDSILVDDAPVLTLAPQYAVEHSAPVQLMTAPTLELRAAYSVSDWESLSADERRYVLAHAPDDKATFNAVNDNIDWAKWSWNPVTGCLHGCDYCYARDIAERFYAQKFAPTFIPSRLSAPERMKLPAKAETEIGYKNVFVCSMADLFGKWVPQDWINAVFDEVRRVSWWNFLFLTKFPQRLAEIEWPENAWCGTSIDSQARVAIAERSFRNVKAGVKWLSVEPMMERLTFTSLDMFDWVVIGSASASTKTPAFVPPWEWVEHLLKQARDAGCKVYFKPNLEKSRPREYPGLSCDRSKGGN